MTSPPTELGWVGARLPCYWMAVPVGDVSWPSVEGWRISSFGDRVVVQRDPDPESSSYPMVGRSARLQLPDGTATWFFASIDLATWDWQSNAPDWRLFLYCFDAG